MQRTTLRLLKPRLSSNQALESITAGRLSKFYGQASKQTVGSNPGLESVKVVESRLKEVINLRS